RIDRQRPVARRHETQIPSGVRPHGWNSESSTEVEKADADSKIAREQLREFESLFNGSQIDRKVANTGTEVNVEAMGNEMVQLRDLFEGASCSTRGDAESKLGGPADRRDHAHTDGLATPPLGSETIDDLGLARVVDVDEPDSALDGELERGRGFPGAVEHD